MSADDTKRFFPVRLSQLAGKTGEFCTFNDDWIVTFGETSVNFGYNEHLARHVVHCMEVYTADKPHA